MTRDEIIKMAREDIDYWMNHYDRLSLADMRILKRTVIERYLGLVADEREACAQLCEKQDGYHDAIYAEAIRARGQK